jgi:hypothetical protein
LGDSHIAEPKLTSFPFGHALGAHNYCRAIDQNRCCAALCRCKRTSHDTVRRGRDEKRILLGCVQPGESAGVFGYADAYDAAAGCCLGLKVKAHVHGDLRQGLLVKPDMALL